MENKEKRVILGLDISTSCTGASIVTKEGNELPKVEFVGYCKFKTSKDFKGTEGLFRKSRYFRDDFIKQRNIGFTDIVIEEPLPNSQNRNTLTSLLRFNGMISQSIYEATGIVPQYISSYDARRFAFPELIAVRKYNKKGEIYPAKHIVSALNKSDITLFGAYPWDVEKKGLLWNLVSERFPYIQWVYNKDNKLIKENYDSSDSLVCVLGFLNKEKYGDTEPVVNAVASTPDGEGGTIYSYSFDFAGQTIHKKIHIPKTS